MTRVSNIFLYGTVLLAFAVCIFPLLAVFLAAMSVPGEAMMNLASTVLPRYAANTVGLVFVTGTLSLLIGMSTAWLVTMTQFPGRRVLEIALVLPFAFPAYVMAYAYTHILDHPGIVQSTLRSVFGWGPRDYWFPEIRSFGGAAVMLALVALGSLKLR